MGLHEGAKEILACADHIYNAPAWWTNRTDTGFGNRSVHLHIILTDDANRFVSRLADSRR